MKSKFTMKDVAEKDTKKPRAVLHGALGSCALRTMPIYWWVLLFRIYFYLVIWHIHRFYIFLRHCFNALSKFFHLFIS